MWLPLKFRFLEFQGSILDLIVFLSSSWQALGYYHKFDTIPSFYTVPNLLFIVINTTWHTEMRERCEINWHSLFHNKPMREINHWAPSSAEVNDVLCKSSWREMLKQTDSFIIAFNSPSWTPIDTESPCVANQSFISGAEWTAAEELAPARILPEGPASHNAEETELAKGAAFVLEWRNSSAQSDALQGPARPYI